jgi:SurA N-terminal domain
VLARRGTLRVLLAGVAATLAVTGLAGCRTSPTVAAYVGDEQISVATLDAAMASREKADTTVAAYGEAHTTEFTRQVLSFLVTQDVYAEVSRRYDITISDDAVSSRIDQLLAGSDPAQAYAQLAAQGIGKKDVVENVRQQLIRQQVAARTGQAGAVTETALQARYEQVKGSLAQRQFGYITVPDQTTAQSVLGQLTANPGAYPSLSGRYPGAYTLPALEARSSQQIPAAFASAVAAAAPNSGFVDNVPQVGFVVVFVGATVVPTYEQSRTQLVQQAEAAIDASAQKVVEKVRTGLHVQVNPRYGVLKNGTISEPTGGAVSLLGSGVAASGSAGSAPTGTPAG